MKLKFNEQKFIEQAKAIYGADAVDECQRIDSKELLHKTIKYADCKCSVFAYKNPDIKQALDTICNNKVGALMLKLIYKHISSDFRPLRIWNNDDTFENLDYKRFGIKITPRTEEEKSNDCFDRGDLIVYLMISDLSNIKFARYAEQHVICGKPEPLDCVLFHELVHALHYLMRRNGSGKTNALDYFYGHSEIKQKWGKFDKPLTDEEFSDITGWYYDKKQSKIRFDPINSNMYEVCKYCKTLNSRMDFHPRISHKGYADLCKFCQEKNISLNDILYKIDDIILNLDEWLLEEDEDVVN